MPNAIRQYYDRTAPYYDLTRIPFLLGRRRALSVLDLHDGQDLLSVGAGTGYGVSHILSAIGSGTLTLLDLSLYSLHIAHSKAGREAHLRSIVADAAHLPLAGTYDRILFSYSLSLIPDPEQILRSITSLLRPGGSLVVADFGPMSGWGALRTIARWWLAKHNVSPVHQQLLDYAREHEGTTVQTIHLGYTLLATVPSSER